MRCSCLLAVGAAATVALQPHPRLVLTDSRRQQIADFASTDPVAKQFATWTIAQADSAVRCPTPAPGDNPPNARAVLQQVYSLGLAWAVTGNETYADAAVATVLLQSASPQWDLNGQVELNTGEMFHAIGFGLDWFFSRFTPEQRANVTSQLVNVGLSKVLAALTQSPPPSWAGAFVNTSSNWNTVILGGAVMGCLAIIGEPGAPAWVNATLLPAALGNLAAWSGQGWAPDGGWKEGPNYGGYTARYLAPTAAALLSATGDDAGILSWPGVLQSPRFMVGSMAPNREYFYWFDTRDIPEAITQYLAFAAYANDSAAAWGIKSLALAIGPSLEPDNTAVTAMNAPVALLYYAPLGTPADEDTLPQVFHWADPNAVTARSSWSDPNATFIGFKGMNTTWNWAHTHLDAGSFVFQTHQQWFAQDLGPDSYALPQYFSKDRFSLYRTSTIGHNTLSFNGTATHCVPLDTYSSDCPVQPLVVLNVTSNDSATAETGRSAPDTTSSLAVDVFAIVDLTPGYTPLDIGVQSVQRGFIVGNGISQLITVDEVAVSTSANVPPLWWSLHTVANISIASDGLSATLTTFNVSEAVTVAVITGANASTCPGAAFTVTPLNLTAPYVPTPGLARLTLQADAKTCNRLVVTVGVSPDTAIGVRPLSQWQQYGPVEYQR